MNDYARVGRMIDLVRFASSTRPGVSLMTQRQTIASFAGRKNFLGVYLAPTTSHSSRTRRLAADIQAADFIRNLRE